jgi:hypothetical protein
MVLQTERKDPLPFDLAQIRMISVTAISKQQNRKKNGPSLEGPICLGSLWLGESIAGAI